MYDKQCVHVCVCEEYKAVGVCVSYFQIGKRILQSGRE